MMRVARLGGGTLRRRLGWLAGIAAVAALALPLLAPGPAAAEELVGAPVPWGMGMQVSASPVKERIDSLHDLMLIVITAIALFVFALLAYTMVRFSAARNPNPSRNSHNATLEVVWTVVPVLILVAIAVPSFRLLYFMDRSKEPDMTLRVTGFQWAWEFEYPDHGGLRFESYMIPDADIQPGQRRLLEVDNEAVVPVGKDIRVLVTSRDVIHSMFVPSLGIQKYGIPGRTLETWFRADRPGVFYGQCNQICGVNHAFMPIVIRAVPQAEFMAWVEDARRRFANDGTAAPALAAAGAAGAATDVTSGAASGATVGATSGEAGSALRLAAEGRGSISD